jgi:hypothetical protein
MAQFEEWMGTPDVATTMEIIITRLVKAAMEGKASDEDFGKAMRTGMVMAFEAGTEAAMTASIDADGYEAMTVVQLAAELKRLKTELDAFGATKTAYQKGYDYLSISILPERMDEEGIGTMKVTGVGRLQVASDIRCSVPAANKEAVQKWLKDHGHGSMISPTTNASTLKAFVREMMKEEKEWPEELLKVEAYSRATVVKA